MNTPTAVISGVLAGLLIIIFFDIRPRWPR